ncbi:MAG: helix-turn-helix domain-containing protein [Chloroflexota bacterium]
MDEVVVDGLELRRLREERDLTQGQLAIKAGVVQSVISNLELGKKPRARISTVRGLARALSVPMERLLTDRGQRIPDVKAPADLDLSDPNLRLVLQQLAELGPEDREVILKMIAPYVERARELRRIGDESRRRRREGQE